MQREDKKRTSTHAVGPCRPVRDFGIFPIPERLRYDPARPPQVGMLLNIVFAFTSTFGMLSIAARYQFRAQITELSRSHSKLVLCACSLVLNSTCEALTLFPPVSAPA